MADLNTLIVLRKLDDFKQYESEVCNFKDVKTVPCFSGKQVQAIADDGIENWATIMGLDWYVLDFLKTADDYYLDAFGLELGLKAGQRWYKSVEA